MQAHRFNAARAIYGGVLAFIFALAAQSPAHSQVARIGTAPQSSPSAAARAAAAAPNPAGLRPPIPAGLTSGSGAAVAADPVAASTALVGPGVTGTASAPNNVVSSTGGGVVTYSGSAAGLNTTLDTAIVDGGSVNTAVMGAGPGGSMARGPAQTVPLGSPGTSAVDIARAFLGADANGDGELSRTEASRLRLPQTFEEMDRNFDGVVTRAEYEDGLR